MSALDVLVLLLFMGLGIIIVGISALIVVSGGLRYVASA